jgi:hypothetical protein
VPFRQLDRKMIASLHHARAIDHRHRSTKLSQLDNGDFEKVREGFWKLYEGYPSRSLVRPVSAR